MKLINKLLLVALVLGMASACELTELDLQENPNGASEDQANVNDLYNSVQLEFSEFYNGIYFFTADMARMSAATGAYQYENNYTSVSFDVTWNNAYAENLPDLDALIALAETINLDIHAGSAKIMKAYILLAMVDVFGNVPFSEALQGTDIISPNADNGEDVYEAAEALLDEAIGQLQGTEATPPTVDNFYGGDPDSWITLANTLKLRIYVTTRLVDSNAGSKIQELLNTGDLIDDMDEDFQFNYGSQRENPNSRHPFYNNSYENLDGDYQSTYYMWLMRSEKQDVDGNDIVDPRIRFYFYRQTGDGLGADLNAYSCHFSETPTQDAKPVHYNDVDPRIPYCIASEDGYWGRDHLNAEGIPPDGRLRTIYGLYPGGGAFDDDSFADQQQNGTTGALGQGINPIMLSSFAFFLRAEAALTAGTGEDPRALMEQGIRSSMDKVLSFASFVDPDRVVGQTPDGEDVTLGDAFLPSDEDIDEYVNHVLGLYDAAASDDERLDVIMKEYYLALYGNGLEAYNLYRRTGKPDNMAPSLEPNPGPFIRTMFYPSVYVDRNQNAQQKALTEQVFWDNNPADFVY